MGTLWQCPRTDSVVQAGQQRNRRCLLCLAEKDDRKDDRDWDNAWSSFKKGAGLDSADSYTDSPSERPPPRQNLSTAQDKVRKQESLLLNLVSNQLFFLVAGGMVFLLLLGVLSVSGTPSDPRCTLPWC